MNLLGMASISVGDNWTCPYCGHAQVLSSERFDDDTNGLPVEGAEHNEKYSLRVIATVCANSECRKLSLGAVLQIGFIDAHGLAFPVPTKSWTLLPASSAKPQPDFIPKAIRDDYQEACAIRDLSPKASATITRRCLQGMIRDFCKISKPKLIHEIEELRKQVDSGHAPAGVLPDSVDAIDHVRKIGNIGAHMEADINVIVDVDPNEAQALIELVETLFEEWYIAAEARKARHAHLKSIARDKAEQKKGPPKADS
jgi:Domain of unknown function (DUF4145)